MASLRIDTSEVIKFTNKLEKLNRSAFPNAVRNTLNNAAFETRKEIPITAQKKFVTRSKSFFRAFTVFDKAKGFDVDKMISKAGINGGKSGGQRVAENLVKQEKGGNIEAGRLTPHNRSRVSNSLSKRIRKKNYKSKVDAFNASKTYRNAKGSNRSKFVASVMAANKSGKKHFILETNGTGMLYEIKSINTNTGNFKLEKLFNLRRESNHKVKGQNYILESANKVSKNIPRFYKKNAEYQFKKALR